MDSPYRFGDFTIWPSERRLLKGEQPVPLPPKVFDALLLLVRNHGRLVSRQEIVSTLWPNTHVSEANRTNIIVILRKILGRDSVQTISKSGYRFVLPVTGEPGIDQAAYAAFVRGKELLNERPRESIGKARDQFLFCIAQDPQFAAAWAWLGRANRILEKLHRDVSLRPSVAEAAFRRAFLLDPDLACAHQFYTQLEVDAGRSRDAIIRLASRIRKFGEDPETMAGLVHVLRYCGLLRESVAAHGRVMALDPAARTSVAHTYFLLGDYPSTLATYMSKGVYLDAAVWEVLGNRDRAITLLRSRISWPDIAPLMLRMMTSLLAILEGRCSEALAIIDGIDADDDPEALFYFARHCGLLEDGTRTIQMIERARLAGFWSSYALEHDSAFRKMRADPGFVREIENARHLEDEYRAVCDRELGPDFFLNLHQSDSG